MRKIIVPWVEKEVRKLQKKGFWFWTKEISSASVEAPLVKSLKESRAAFISILTESEPSNLLQNLLNPSKPLTRKMAIKHAMIATDASAELLDRTKSYIAFKKFKILHAQIGDHKIEYRIKRLGTIFTKRLTNKLIYSANAALLSDLFYVICFGSTTSEFANFLSFRRFRLAELCGNHEAIQKHFQELYLDVSRQLTQLTAQSRGELLNTFVKSKLDACFANNSSIKYVENRRVPGVGDKRAKALGGEQFDLVYAIKPASGREIKYVAIEVAFQETTNSTMERKARQATLLFVVFNKMGYKLCFVVDGAGFLSARPKALRDIIQSSHFRVTLKPEELFRLGAFIISLTD